jgi:hypothetical protein
MQSKEETFRQDLHGVYGQKPNGQPIEGDKIFQNLEVLTACRQLPGNDDVVAGFTRLIPNLAAAAAFARAA